MPDAIDPANKFLVSARGDDLILVLSPANIRALSRADALNLAAWLAALADPTGGQFPPVLEAVRNT